MTKMHLNLLLYLVLIGSTLSCKRVDDIIEMNESDEVYINYSIAGNQKNGTFSIVGDRNDSKLNAYGLVYPENGSTTLKVAEVAFLDGNQLISVDMKVPARTGLVELTNSHPNFVLGFGFDDLNLKSKSVSMNIEEIEITNLDVIRIKGSFDGIAIHEFTKDGIDVEESYIVNGKFEYNDPF